MFCDRIEISCESVEHVCILHLQDWYKAEAKHRNISSDPARSCFASVKDWGEVINNSRCSIKFAGISGVMAALLQTRENLSSFYEGFLSLCAHVHGHLVKIIESRQLN